ncbi:MULTISPECIES: isochorismate synthase DhbC [unclassified Paenibacillus]|uniref:isochorismate synthase DhbC n=1 Tax=unclassified Paenibacillus TaxID=185978 RepID=UPI000953FA90|nr:MULTISPECIES: isochorismate synthase DhbC [unclassified Paenibacillus]ASS65351.1 isochorismate synthase DhbC [Paenibacillus sp. RUD330]SIQ38984.1 isochorismate synthase [Paenibacillus sp. RU4X]SIQ61174.1 isochorismate synthase [Paenibacillus sp. RU4T]
MNHLNAQGQATEATAAELLENYQPGQSFFLATPQATWLAQGTLAVLPNEAGYDELATLPERASRLLAQLKQDGRRLPMLVGAVPFDPRQAAHLVVPLTVRKLEKLNLDPHAPLRTPLGGSFTIEPIPAPEAYAAGASKAIERMRAGEVDKIVLARTLKLASQQPIRLKELLHNLAQHNTLGYTFAVDLPGRTENAAGSAAPARARTLIGASPEMLVARTGTHVYVNPLAGSAPRSPDAAEDRKQAQALLASPKDLREHGLVIEAVAQALQPFCRKLEIPEKPSLVSTEAMWHLSTEIRGELEDPGMTSLALAIALHPTPAVCGSPTGLAMESIYELEPFDRGFYAGLVGWCDADGDGEWIIALRCALAESHSLQLYAGAGVVAESSAEAELRETSAKFRTMLRAMGVQDDEAY